MNKTNFLPVLILPHIFQACLSPMYTPNSSGVLHLSSHLSDAAQIPPPDNKPTTDLSPDTLCLLSLIHQPGMRLRVPRLTGPINHPLDTTCQTAICRIKLRSDHTIFIERPTDGLRDGAEKAVGYEGIRTLAIRTFKGGRRENETERHTIKLAPDEAGRGKDGWVGRGRRTHETDALAAAVDGGIGSGNVTGAHF